MHDQPTVLRPDDVAEAARELGVPGVAVGVDHGGKRETVTYGVTSIEYGRPVDEATLFQIGSTAKTFTATAIMVLVDQGRIDLDQPVRRYLPELRLLDGDAAETLTVGQLLNHTAGWDGGDVWTDTGEGDDALERSVALLADLPQQFAPGTAASYNNAAFVLAGRVVEKVTGETFERALARLVLDPLGMRQTLTSLNEIMTRPYAAGHRAASTTDSAGSADGVLSMSRPWSDPRGYLPAGARLASSLGDQLTWARFQLGDGRSPDGTRVLSEQRLRAMHTPTTSHELWPGVRVGIAWLLREIDGVRLIEHHGDVSGQHSTVTVVPEHDFAIVVLTNATPSGRELAERIVREALESRLGLVERPPEPLSLSPDDLAPYAGDYRTEGLDLRVVVDGTGLLIHGTLTDDGVAETLEFPSRLLPGERFLVVGGPFAGLQGEFVREADAVVAVKHVGRLVPRAAEPSA
ncbi:CubicO group peptidase, beta-lactamase class C family [Actinopolymorpha cephalotaxi]|uniref:CubicO group peptidase (Beta-lactamase class C family) n=1 Tax=Actinopolymorpha cephalotaxi TaxID=504797 RepID=A0A1I2S8K6_9ACTN|nr:serine hydrolase [Actinopolymorpha cephalotaxi]NYH87075.1 CubicO group peptidase (beta-lactamase class C family) [Actinopolymorpha cephalotaxi]SFG49080.1 CubicO group peptidase, beta-lactamase class C family [Actinopolymorpha cephalotaxi]